MTRVCSSVRVVLLFGVVWYCVTCCVDADDIYTVCGYVMHDTITMCVVVVK